MSRWRTLFVASSAALAGFAADARAQIFRVTASGSQEIPANASPGTGTAIVTLNPVTHEMRLVGSFTGLTANTTVAHIHCCVVQPGNAGVATTVPTFVGFPAGVTSGSFDLSYLMTAAGTWNPAFIAANGGTPAGAEAALFAGAALGRPYLNIHTTAFPGGEIRGQLVLQTFAGNPGLSARTAGVAGALDSLGAGTGALNTALINLAILTPAAQAAALERLTPNTSRGALLAAADGMTQVFDQISNRLDGLRTPTGDDPSSTWIKVYGFESQQDAADGFAGFDGDGYGVAAGFDTALASGLNIGAALSYADSSISYNDQLAGNGDDIASTQLTIYASHEMGGIFFDAMAAYAWQDYDGVRNTGFTGSATADRDGEQVGARLGAGMPFDLGGMMLTPQARLDWMSIDQDSYAEAGGGALALNVGETSHDMLRSSLGAQLDFNTDMGGMEMRPYVRAFWRHDFEDEGADVNAAFIAGGASFTTPGQELEADTYALGLGINFVGGEGFSAGVAYDAVFGDDYDSQSLQARLRWSM